MKRYLWALGCAAFLGSLIAFGFGKSSIEVTVSMGFLLLFFQRELHRSLDRLEG